METGRKPLILVTNDDGIQAAGIALLCQTVEAFGDVIVVAPDSARSAQSHAITVSQPIRMRKLEESEHKLVYTCSGTPVDCVKLALSHLCERTPDLIVSGINHGSNTSVSVLYSGTMAAAVEGCFYGIPAIGFSLDDHRPEADFSAFPNLISTMVEKVLKDGLDKGVCLNVNVPAIPSSSIKGVKWCRQARGSWSEVFERREDPYNREYFWLTGDFVSLEPEAQDTDAWAIANGYVAVTTVQTDMTAYHSLQQYQDQWSIDCQF